MAHRLSDAVCFAILFFCSLQQLLQPCSCQPPPPPPNLSNSFSAKVKQLAGAGVEVKGEMYVNHKLNKELQITDLGSTATLKGVGKVHTLDIGQTKTEYVYLEPMDFCSLSFVVVNLTPVWSWLANATLKGTEEFQGKQVNVWTYKDETSMELGETQAGFLAMDDNTPVYLISPATGIIIFEEYDNTPPPESKFVIPERCTDTLPPTKEQEKLLSKTFETFKLLKIR